MNIARQILITPDTGTVYTHIEVQEIIQEARDEWREELREGCHNIQTYTIDRIITELEKMKD